MSGARLLVVDEQINLEIIAEYLEGQGFDLTLAQDGEKALRLLTEGRSFDAVILDRMMPGLDGLEVLRRIRHDQRLRGIPVVMQTAATGHEQVAEALRLGAYYYLTKPYHRDALVAVVNSALDMVRRRLDLAREIEQYRGLLVLLDEGQFRVRTLREAHALAAGLSTLAVDPASAALGLVELLINAIEHGNLGIDFYDKPACSPPTGGSRKWRRGSRCPRTWTSTCIRACAAKTGGCASASAIAARASIGGVSSS